MSEPTTKRDWEPEITPEDDAAFLDELHRIYAEKAAAGLIRNPENPLEWIPDPTRIPPPPED